jgi:hypothetical protein
MLDFDSERSTFKHMDFKDQSIVLFDMLRYIRSEIAGLRKDFIAFQNDVQQYRMQRESTEMTTTSKIKKVLGERFDFWTWFRDKVLPTILTTIIVAVLILAFGKP